MNTPNNNKNQTDMNPVQFDKQLIQLEDKLERYALSLTSDREDAKDLLQETFHKALVNRDKFIRGSSMKAWTFTIMKNTFINNYRKKQKEKMYYDKTDNDNFLNRTDESSPLRPDSEYSIIEVNRKIEELPDEFRVPFKMFLSGYKYKEIAEKLQLKMGTIKSRIFFTRKKLYVKLLDYRNE
ncbi:MAG: RNA polymerase sigma factor [Bacteroidales bacterium]